MMWLIGILAVIIFSEVRRKTLIYLVIRQFGKKVVRIFVSEELIIANQRTVAIIVKKLEKEGATVTSTYRGQVKNKKVGGTVNSKHLLCAAVDVIGVTIRECVRIMKELGCTKFGRSSDKCFVFDEKDHIHIGLPIDETGKVIIS